MSPTNELKTKVYFYLKKIKNKALKKVVDEQNKVKVKQFFFLIKKLQLMLSVLYDSSLLLDMTLINF